MQTCNQHRTKTLPGMLLPQANTMQESSSEDNGTLRSLRTKYKLNSRFLRCLRENTCTAGGNENSPKRQTVHNGIINDVINKHSQFQDAK